MATELDRLARRIRKLEATVRALGAAPQLASSSIVGGAITQTEVEDSGTLDEFGNVVWTERPVAVFGLQADGSNAAVSLAGPKPPTPTGFTVAPGVGFITVEWFGEFSNRVEAYLDHDYVAAHVGVSSGFTPIADTVKATIRARQGETVVIPLEPGSYFVTLVAVSQSGRWSDPAPYTAGEPGAAAVAVDVAAREMAQAAFDLADGKSRVRYSVDLPAGTVVTDADGVATVTPPVGSAYRDGDLWYRLGPAPSRLLSDVFVFDSGVWRAKLLSDSAVGSLSAAKITTGTLDAATSITVGAAAPVVLGDSSLTVLRDNPDGVKVPTIRVGGMLGDNLVIMDPATGATKAGFNSDGDGVARNFDVDSLTVGGIPLQRIVVGSKDIQAAGFRAVDTRPTITTTQYGLFEVAADLHGGRVYCVTFRGNFTHSAAGGMMRLFLRSTADGSAPLTTSNQLTMGWFGFPVASLPIQHHISTFFHIGSNPETVLTVRILVSAQTLSGTAAFYPDGGTTPGWFTIDDVAAYDEGFMLDGAASGGDPGSPPPPVSTQTRVKTYTSTWTRTWRNGSVRGDTTDAVQGYSGAQNYAQVGFPTDVYTDLNGSAVQRIEVYLKPYHWYSYAGGAAVIGVHGNVTAPASFSYSGSLTSSNWPRGAGRWVTLPSAWYAGFAAGTSRGITLGGGASPSTVFYGRFYGTAASTDKPAIRITYVK